MLLEFSCFMQMLTADRCKRPRGRHYQTALRLFHGIITKIAGSLSCAFCEGLENLMKSRCIARGTARHARIVISGIFMLALINLDFDSASRVCVSWHMCVCKDERLEREFR